MKIIVHPAAAADLNNAAAFYSAQANKQLGMALIAEFEKAAALLSGSPDWGAPWVSGTRRVGTSGKGGRFGLNSYILKIKPGDNHVTAKL